MPRQRLASEECGKNLFRLTRQGVCFLKGARVASGGAEARSLVVDLSF